ncbi:NAD(P)-binding protein [Streptomyces sp. NPDC057582]|uniref:NAD(P)-binding protein n=1 Tax=unclassified Streptomyces TaxID=2593676 RepID=UPI0036A02D8A
MSRTHAMHALRQLAAEHAAARRLRIPVAEVRASTCRELLGRATAIGLSTALGAGLTGRTATAQARTRGATPTVAVVGAGIAGLTAALTLKDAGLNCTLYESNPDRVGGRI